MVREYFYRENNSGIRSSHGSNGFVPKNGDRNMQWLTEAIKKASMDLYETAITMLESAIHNMDEAQLNVTSSGTQNQA